MPLNDDQLFYGLTLLARLAKREPDRIQDLSDAIRRGLPGSLSAAARVAIETGQPMGTVLTLLVQELEPEQLESIARALPKDSVALRLCAERVFARQLELGQRSAGAGPGDRLRFLISRAES